MTRRRETLLLTTLVVQLLGCGGGSQGSSPSSGGTGGGGNGTGGQAVADAVGQSDLAGEDTATPDNRAQDAGSSGGDSGVGADASGGSLPRPMIWQMESGPKDVVGAMGGSGPTDVWFAGSNGTVLHTAGDGKWENRNFNGPTFTGLFVAGPNDVYATGMINVVYHWDGSGTWDHQFLGTAFEDNGIWGSGPHDIYTVGSGAFHSTGDRVWTPQSLTGAPASFSPFRAVWGSGPTDIYFLIGDASVLHSHGDDKWDTQTTGLKAYGAGLWGSGPNDIYALSTDVVAHSVGDGKWSVQKFDRTSDETPSSIWGSGARDVYIGTVDGTIFRSLGDGKWYRERLFPNDSRKFIVVAAIWGSSADDVYVVTSVGTLRGHPQ